MGVDVQVNTQSSISYYFYRVHAREIRWKFAMEIRQHVSNQECTITRDQRGTHSQGATARSVRWETPTPLRLRKG